MDNLNESKSSPRWSPGLVVPSSFCEARPSESDFDSTKFKKCWIEQSKFTKTCRSPEFTVTNRALILEIKNFEFFSSAFWQWTDAKFYTFTEGLSVDEELVFFFENFQYRRIPRTACLKDSRLCVSWPRFSATSSFSTQTRARLGVMPKRHVKIWLSIVDQHSVFSSNWVTVSSASSPLEIYLFFWFMTSYSDSWYDSFESEFHDASNESYDVIVWLIFR